MSDPLRFEYQSTPAEWACYWNPEGPVGYGKTKEAALGNLMDFCDDENGPVDLMAAIVAAIETPARSKENG